VLVRRLAVVVLLAACGATPCRAEETVRLRLRYEVPAGCPDEAAFVGAVRARTALARFESDGAAPTVGVVVQQRDGWTWGTLTRVGALPRDVTGESCDDVVSALALILSLTIEPRADAPSGGAPGVAADPAPPPAMPPAAPPVAAPPVMGRAAPETVDAIALPPRTRGRSAFWGVATAATASPALTRSWVTLIGAALSGEVGTAYTPVLAPSLRLSAALDVSPTVVRPPGSATFMIYRARTEVRPLRFAAGALQIVPFVGLDAGSVVGHGHPGAAITVARTENRLWLALSEGAALELPVEPFFLTASAEIDEPLRRYGFVFDTPNVDIIEVPSVALGFALGAGLRFW